MGGTAYQKSPAGSLFYDFFGENTMKSDISVSVGELGSLLITQDLIQKPKSILLKLLMLTEAILLRTERRQLIKLLGNSPYLQDVLH